MVSIINGQKLLSIAEAAEILGVTPKAVYEWSDAKARSSKGKRWLETCEVGGRIKTTLECIQRFLYQRAPLDDQQETVSSNLDGHDQAMRDLALL